MTVNVAGAIRDCLISPNEIDLNLEPANVVDGLFAIARALEGISKALRGIDSSITTEKVGSALDGLANLSNYMPPPETGE